MSVRLSEMNLPRFPLLTDEEMNELLKKVQEGDTEARERLINCNLRLVFNLVKRFANRGYELEDLFQIGTIGLIKAIDKFNMSYNVKFSTYAVPMIIGEIRRFLRDDNPVKVSRSLKENAYRINKARDTLTKELEREPTLQEIAEKVELSTEEIVASLEAVQMPSSIHDTLYQDDGDPIYLIDQLSSEKDENQWFEKLALREVLNKLSEKEREIIMIRFFQDKTQMEVAQMVGLSQVQVSRIERQALKKFKSLLNEDGCQTG
ncbi:MAG TPA: RNA polymerase sporulation sigma factor SigF [Peptococcaceae bacterium]|jgi:RNA polymerase sporulation-specific sigma factor|nr:RNA polymerase sporulation sigma factor SigF [Peptococcaceae bacterium]HPZ71735.1 RNA polymerase sporulation sigma factor SigF [Peptococcaceae bacterium]HQD53552.1 RNA polymerase sporulation sigma factor SigF [Peptococcaceae bacterium]